MNSLFPILVFFLITACASGLQQMQGAGETGGTQAQPNIQETTNVEGPTPVEECADDDYDCHSQNKGLTNPEPPPPEDPKGPDQLKAPE